MRKAVVTVVLTVGLVGAIIAALAYAGSSGSGGGSDQASGGSTTTTLSAAQKAEQAESQAWDNEANQAFGADKLAGAVHDLVQGIDDWKAGTKPTDQMTAELAKELVTLQAARDAVANLRPYPRDPDPGHPMVNRLYLRSAEMYVMTLRLYQVMVTLPPGALRDQEELLAKRVRELGDRVFDRGRAFVLPHLFQETPENVQINLPEEVPKWAAEGELPGPPLDDPPPSADRFPPTHQDKRPTEDRTKWLDAVRHADIPEASDLASAIGSGNADRLKLVARTYVDATEKLRNEPDPDTTGGREESARVRIGLLVDADAARTAQMATLVPDAPSRARLEATARRLALIGDELWLPDLPARSTAFDPALLTSDGP